MYGMGVTNHTSPRSTIYMVYGPTIARHCDKINIRRIHGHITHGYVTDVRSSDARHCRSTSRNTVSLAPRMKGKYNLRSKVG